MAVTWISVLIASKRQIAEGIQAFELVDPQGARLPPFTPGAHVDVEVRPGLVRQYSLSSSPDDTSRYEIAVLRDDRSRGGSIGMHDDLVEGGVVNISAPRNHFELVENAGRSILFAGGIGITPLICMAERLSRSGAAFALHYCGRSKDRMAFLDRLAEEGMAPHVRLHFDDGPADQRLDPAAALGEPDSDTHVYVCGPSGFIDWVFEAGAGKGWPAARFHREYFSAAEPEPQGGDRPFDVRIASTGQTYTIPPDRTVAEVLAEKGIDIPVSCQQGVCGTCTTRILEGEPDHRDLVLMGTETDEFTPCCSRAKTDLLVLDL